MSERNVGDRRVVVLGGGGHAAVVVESARRAGWTVVGVAAKDRPDSIDASWLGDPDDAAGEALAAARAAGARLHAAVGDGAVRARWLARFGEGAFAAIVDPSAVVAASARIGPGAFVGARAVVQSRADIRALAIVNTAAIVEHDAIVEPCAHVAPGAILCGSVRIGARTQVGAGAVVIPGKLIGVDASIGAGAVVVRDVPDGATVAGVPARSLVGR